MGGSQICQKRFTDMAKLDGGPPGQMSTLRSEHQTRRGARLLAFHPKFVEFLQ